MSVGSTQRRRYSMRSDISFAIPSYKRAGKVKTLHMLECYGVPRDQIYIFVQTQDDKDKYEDAFGDRANVVYREANNCAGNRNNALNYLREHGYKYVLLMDDDVSNLMRMVPSDSGKTRFKCKTIKLTGGSDSEKQFSDLLEEHVRIIDNGVVVVSAYGDNPLNLSNRKYLKRKLGLIRGTYMLFGENSPLFNEQMPCCDDNELSARIIANGGDSIIDETVVVSTQSMQETTSNSDLGGCAEYYTSDENSIASVQEEFILKPFRGIIRGKINNRGGRNRYYTLFVENV